MDQESHPIKQWKIWVPISLNVLMSIFAYTITVRLIPRLKDMFIKANLFGIDMSKRTGDKVYVRNNFFREYWTSFSFSGQKL